MVVLDTSILIDYVRTKGTRKTPFEEISGYVGKRNLAISILTIQELFRGKSAANEEVEKTLLAIINSLAVLPYTFEVAKKGGEISRDYDVSFPDAAIAATSIVNGAQLATLNPKDFTGIPHIELLKLPR